MRGRKPKPLKRQIAEGDTRKVGKHKLQQKLAAEPKPSSTLPDCPKHLKGRARMAWNFWRIELAAMKLDARPDAMMLEGACVNYSRAVEADLMLAIAGLVVETPICDKEGEVIGMKLRNHPAVAISNAAWRNLRGFCSEFGLSPVSRTRLAIEKPNDGEHDLLKMLDAPRKAKTQKHTIQ